MDNTIRVTTIGAVFLSIINNGQILGAITLALISMTCVFVAILLDLNAGVRKSKKRGEFESSYRLRQTVDKLIKYYSALFIALIIDTIQIATFWNLNNFSKFTIPLIPIFTIVVALGLCYIEGKSIFESPEAKDKAKMQDIAKLAKAISKVSSPDQLAKALLNHTADTFLDEADKNKEQNE